MLTAPSSDHICVCFLVLPQLSVVSPCLLLVVSSLGQGSSFCYVYIQHLAQWAPQWAIQTWVRVGCKLEVSTRDCLPQFLPTGVRLGSVRGLEWVWVPGLALWAYIWDGKWFEQEVQFGATWESRKGSPWHMLWFIGCSSVTVLWKAAPPFSLNGTWLPCKRQEEFPISLLSWMQQWRKHWHFKTFTIHLSWQHHRKKCKGPAGAWNSYRLWC